MARDSRRADPRRVVAVDSGGSGAGGGGGGGGGGSTARCKLVLVLSTLLLAIIIPAAYAESQGESRSNFFRRYVTELSSTCPRGDASS